MEKIFYVIQREDGCFYGKDKNNRWSKTLDGVKFYDTTTGAILRYDHLPKTSKYHIREVKVTLLPE
jgi:hypothetical protein